MKRLLFFLALLAALAASSVAAEDFYLGVAVGDGVDDGGFGRQLNEFGPQSEGTPAKLFAGWRVNPHLSLEASTYELGGRSCCPQLADAGFDTELDAYALSVVGRVPLGAAQRLELSGRVGAQFWEETGTEITIAGPREIALDGTDLVIGAGAWWQVLEQLSLGFEWEVLKVGEASLEVPWILLRLDF